MLPISGRLPEGPEWCYEVSWDGMRVLAEVTGGTLRLTSRTGRDVTAHFPEFTGLVDLVGDGLFDGEIILLDAGLPSSVALADRMRVTGSQRPARMSSQRSQQMSRRRPAVLMAFDVLRLYGVSLLHRPLEERRATLERVGLERVDVGAASCVALSPVYDDGLALLLATRSQHLEGVIAKRRDVPYHPGIRDPSWVKVVHEHG